jgi:transcriptional regulator with XRE-family HTH domain
MAGPPKISATLGTVVRDLRKNCGDLSIEELAYEGGLEASYLSGIERKLRQPSLEKIQGIAAAFGMEASDLVKLAEDREREKSDDGQDETKP